MNHVSEQELMERLDRIFPQKTIYSQSYVKSVQFLGIEVRKQARINEQSSVQWLTSRGFVWKETGYVEPDMQERSYPILNPDEISAGHLAHYALSHFPLAGEYILTPEENEALYQAACQVVNKLFQQSGRVTDQEKMILTVATVELLKNWVNNQDDEENGNAFWNYIFLQYGFNPENSDAARGRLYNRFRAIIEETITRCHRFFAPPGTHRYYTSLLLHAVAPANSIESLYNILFDFYAKNLDYQYVPEDTSYQAFVKGMQARWKSEQSNSDKLKLRSDTVTSGLKTLFTERPGYMAVLCDSIVQKMDAILRGEETIMNPQRNRWDALLLDWYTKKSTSERVAIQGERKRRKVEYVATSKDRIYVQYTLRDSVVGLSVPRIRLSEVEERRPVITISQGPNTIYEQELSVTGNDLLMTTRSCFIPLSVTAFDFSQEPTLRVEIEYGGEVLYESGRKLHCNYVVFDEAGNCRLPKSGIAYLFAGDTSSVVFEGESGAFRDNHPGQLYRLNLSEVTSLAVDGEELFVSETAATRIRHYAAIRRVPAVRALEEGRAADIFSEKTQITIRLPDEANIMRYQLSLDGVHYPANQFRSDGNELILPSCGDDGHIHSIRVVDLETSQVKDEYLYTVKDGFSVAFDKPLYRPCIDEVGITITYQGTELQCHLPLPDDSYHIRSVIPHLEAELDFHVPAVFCTFMGANAFSVGKILWHKDIPADEFVSLSLPSGWTGQLMLGTNEVPLAAQTEKFDLGNTLRAITQPPDEVYLWMYLHSEAGETIPYEITTVRFTPTFACEPMEVLDDRDLLWLPQENYIGDADSQFHVEWVAPNGHTFSQDMSTKNANLQGLMDCPKGIYQYRVFLKKKSVFSAGTETELYQGEFTVGDPLEFMYEGKEINLHRALCWDFDEEGLQSVELMPRCGIATNIRFVDISIPSGETIPVPCYSATLIFETWDGRRVPFNSQQSDLYEEVNPVHIYIINEHLLILHCYTGDGVYVDQKYTSIVNKTPAKIMTKQEMQTRLKTPDYFEYSVSEVKYSV